MTESERLIENETEAIECLKSNKPTSGYVMLQESIDMAIQALENRYRRNPYTMAVSIAREYGMNGKE